MARALKSILAFLLLSTLLLVVFSVAPLSSIAGGAVAWTASTILGWCLGVRVGWSLTAANDIGIAVPAGALWEGGIVELQTLLFIKNMPLFIAAVLAAKQKRRRYVSAVLFGGLVGLTLLDGIVVAHTTWETVAVGSRPTSLAFELLALPSVYSGTGGMSVAPIFLGAFVAMLLPASAPERRAVGVRRNMQCSCGSGLKAKRCCR